MVTAEPPLDAAALKVMVALDDAAEAPRLMGALGTVRGVARVALDSVPEPAAFFAATVHEYCVPLVRPISPAVVVDGEVFLIFTVVPSVHETT